MNIYFHGGCYHCSIMVCVSSTNVAFRFMVRHILDLFEHVKTAAKNKETEWNTILQRIHKQIHLRMVSCCQVASKIISHYKV